MAEMTNELNQLKTLLKIDLNDDSEDDLLLALDPFLLREYLKKLIRMMIR